MLMIVRELQGWNFDGNDMCCEDTWGLELRNCGLEFNEGF